MKYLIFLMLIFSTACSKKDQVRSTRSAMLIVNASPNAGKLVVLQNLKPIGIDYSYLTGFNPGTLLYNVIDSGFNNYKIKKGSTEIASTLFSNNSNKNSFWIYDSLSTSTLKYLFISDNLDTPGRAKAKLRYLFLSPDMDTVNVSRNDTINLISNASYYQTQQQVDRGGLASFVTVDTGKALIKLVKINSSTIIKTYQLRFESNAVYTFLFKGYQNRGGADSLSFSLIKHN